ncbi:Receptor-type tyrosine-protein phosphatase delta [Trichoplax sp. H2]|nr:Receptor-type tyrosine-protein phosphatase delta [Trichoplax sp. H2]|eukprot:RDD42223.1 Receptor-type tyrosine-protein phosphatase delta [Trichoplax sp. H2]
MLASSSRSKVLSYCNLLFYYESTLRPIFINISTIQLISAENKPEGFPNIISGPETGSRPFILGNRKEIICNAIGNPYPKVIWEKNYMEINILDHQGRIFIAKNGSLIIYSAIASDDGTYGCAARNQHGSYFSKRVYYHVTERDRPPAINEFSKNLTMIRGNSIRINCTVEGYPTPSIQWKCINSTSAYPLESAPVIILRKLTSNITCTCKASNSLGQDTKYFKIIIVDLPIPPENLIATNITSRNFILRWQLQSTQISGNIHQKVDRYILRYKILDISKNNDRWSSVIFVHNDELKTFVDQLSPATRYQFNLSSVNNYGESHSSNTLTITTAEAAPSSPLNVMVYNLNHESVEVMWNPPSKPNGIITEYVIIYAREADQSSNNTIKVSNHDEFGSRIISNLINGTAYWLTMAAKTSAGQGPFSLITNFTVQEGAPSHPRNLTVTMISEWDAQLNWVKPKYGISIIQQYGIVVNTYDKPKIIKTPKMESFVLRSLLPYRNYTVYIYAIANTSMSQSSNVIIIQTPPKKPSKPPTSISATVISPHAIRISWELPSPDTFNGPLRSIRIFIREKVDNINFDIKTVSYNITEYTYTGLKANKKYLISLQVENILYRSERSRSISVRTFPEVSSAVFKIRVDKLNATWIKISWDPPTLSSSQSIDGYTVTWYKRSAIDTKEGELTLAKNQHTCYVKNLLPSGSYVISIIPFNVAGNGISSTIEIKTAPLPPSAPQITAKVLSGTTVDVEWTVNAKEVTNFYLTIRQMNEIARVTRLSGFQTFFRFFNLIPNTTYIISINAQNSAGTGKEASITVTTKPQEATPSSRATSTFIGTKSTTRTSTVQTTATSATAKASTTTETTISFNGDQLGSVIAYNVTSNSVFLNWSVISSLKKHIIGYTIKYTGQKMKDSKSKSAQYVISDLAASETTYTIEDLQPYTQYHFEVTAMVSNMIQGVIGDIVVVTLIAPPIQVNKVQVTNATKWVQPGKTFAVEVSLQPASEENGPLSHYDLIVIAANSTLQDLIVDNIYQDFAGETILLENTTYMLLEYGNKLLQIYKTARFLSTDFPNSFIVGDKNASKQFYNRPLSVDHHQGIFLRAYVHHKVTTEEASFTSSKITKIFPPQYKDPNPSSAQLSIIISASSVTIVLLILISATLVILRAYRSTLKPKEEVNQAESLNEVSVVKPDTTDEEFESVIKHTVEDSWKEMNIFPPVPVSSFCEYVKYLAENKNLRFKRQFETIQRSRPLPCLDAIQESNQSKNRYSSVLPYDYSRVVLQEKDDIPGSDYINASYIQGHKKENAYIACQAPLEDTVNDFWRMIWEQNSSSIIMISNSESGRQRQNYVQYWPGQVITHYGDDGSVKEEENNSINVMRYDDFSIQAIEVKEAPAFIISNLKITKYTNGESMSREIRHFHFLAWPDHGVPERLKPFILFLKRVKALSEKDEGPMIVHCGAGIGRTGTFICINILLNRLLDDKILDVYSCVTLLRSQRASVVQTWEQYKFIHDILVEWIFSGETEVQLSKLRRHINNLLKANHSSITELQQEFKQLQTSSELAQFPASTTLQNLPKNRSMTIFPFEFNRIILSNTAEDSDYINASFIEGFKCPENFIVTQAPLHNTVNHFWQMIWDNKVEIIVNLTELKEGLAPVIAHDSHILERLEAQSSHACYYPSQVSEEIVRYHTFTIKNIGETKREDHRYSICQLEVSNANEDNCIRNIKLFRFLAWPEDSVPSGTKSILSFIYKVMENVPTKNQDPILVHCSNGGGRSGVFCALWSMMKRAKVEKIADVYQTVKYYREQRSGMVSTLDQYEFCYRALDSHIRISRHLMSSNSSLYNPGLAESVAVVID